MMALKRLIRPLIPDRLVAWLRLRQQSRHSRQNVLMFVDDPRSLRRWAAVTPDTYRATLVPPAASHKTPHRWIQEPFVPEVLPSAEIVVAADSASAESVLEAVTALSNFALDAVIVGHTLPPRLWQRARQAPDVRPLALATWGVVWNEAIQGSPSPLDLRGITDRIENAGRRIGLIPVVGQPDAAPSDSAIDKPLAVIFSAVPLHDVGGGSRAAQMALELLRRDYHVVFVNAYEAAETVDLGLRFLHPHLEQVRLADFDVLRLTARGSSQTKVTIVELPAGHILGPVTILSQAGFRVVYDLIDEWSAESLGGDWYHPAFEKRVAGLADVLVASAPDLVDRLESMTGRRVTLVPNGVNALLFGGDPGPLPSDFPPGTGPVIGYHGSLYGDWFDWTALARVARSFDGARLIVIGDDRGHPPLPANVHFLGLKPQASLLDYVGRFDVGLVPFVVSEVTHAVSPLKAYEYLAAGVPVAAPPLRALAGIEGVHVADDLEQAVHMAIRGNRPDRAHSLRSHSWGERLCTLFGAAGLPLGPAEGLPTQVKQRPPVHYRRKERII